MKRLDRILKGLHALPEHFLPCPGFIESDIDVCLRPSILDLCEAFDSRKGWRLEDTFAEWLSRQPWRHALPPVRMLLGFRVLEWQCDLRLLVPNDSLLKS